MVYDQRTVRNVIFWFLHFSFFRISNDYSQKPFEEKQPFLQWISKVFIKFNYVTNNFHLQMFGNQTTAV